MNKPELYNASNNRLKGISMSTLKEHANKIKWNKVKDTAIDLGCGDGGLTVLLKNFAPYGYKSFVACDLSETMIHFAKERYAGKGISFKVMDIGGEVPEDMKGVFNHVFSFYTLHWVKDQEKAFRNIYSLMSEEGDFFMTWVSTAAIYSAYAVLAHYPRWMSLLKDVDSFIGPYHEMQNPENNVAEILAKCGFTNIDITCKIITNVYNSVQALKDFVQSVEPFNMPDEVAYDFIQDYIVVSQELGVLCIESRNNGEKVFVTHDEMLVAFANKK